MVADGGEEDRVSEEYQELLRRKDLHVPPTGIGGADVSAEHLFPFQRDLVRWALRRGRAALFADTGLGKTRQQLTWADAVATYTGGRVLILAPLAVATTGTVPEAQNIGIGVRYARKQADADRITVTNYDMLEHFDPSAFAGIVLDESSILKDETSKTRNEIIGAFAGTPFRLACTATPSPNDFTELGNHAEFLGVMRRVEMLAQFFTHDGGSTQDWHLKGHAREKFWRWVCSWAALVKSPADLGYDAGAYDLPPLVMHDHVVRATREQAMASGKLFADPASTLSEQRAARRASMADRVSIAANLAAAEPDESWIFWCELNDESEALAEAIQGAIEVRGNMSREEKEDALLYFATGRSRVLVSKPSICGFGLNWQHCARAAFVGVSHSFEQWYQAIRRNWRYGQKREVHCHVITSELEGDVLANLRRKEADASKLAEEMRRYTAAIVRENVRGAERESDAYEPTVEMTIPEWVKSDRSRA
jgi:superfamily II DNA or RNA helicase